MGIDSDYRGFQANRTLGDVHHFHATCKQIGKETALTKPGKPLPPTSDEEEQRIQKGIEDDPENPEWTAEEFAKARPFREVFPDLAASIDRVRGRPHSENPKQQVSIRLDRDVVEKFKATGKGWQARVNAVLKAAKL